MTRATVEFYRQDEPTGRPGAPDRLVYRWRVRGGNGRILADSGQGYVRIEDAAHGLHLLTGMRLDLAAEQLNPQPLETTWRVTVTR